LAFLPGWAVARALTTRCSVVIKNLLVLIALRNSVSLG
jgi:hypothetical protein